MIGDIVIVAVYLDMVVDIDPGLFPFGIHIPVFRKGFQGWFVYRFKQFPSGGVELLEFAVV